jgi:Protein of unknown function (DUF1524)/Protein of unknown function DUF262
MGTLLTAQTMTLPSLLRSHRRFLVPPHQRVYGWGETQIERLLTDFGVRVGARNQVSIAPSALPWLFLGTIYLSHHDTGVVVDIADGQQRVVTATMLYAVARDLEADAGERQDLAALIEVPNAAMADVRDRYRLVLKDLDADFFRIWVQEPGATLKPFVSPLSVADTDDEGEASSIGFDERASSSHEVDADDDLRGLSESQRNIIENRDLIVTRLQALTTDERRRLMANLATHSEVVVITAPTIDVARNAYASTTTRGLRQAQTDTIKTEIIGAAPPFERANLAYHWDECEASLGKDGLEDLLGLLVLVKTSKPAKHDLQSAVLEAYDLPSQVRSFVEGELVPSAAVYREILETAIEANSRFFKPISDRNRARKINGHLIALLRLGHHEWQAPAIVALKTLRGDLDGLGAVLEGLERMATIHAIVGLDAVQSTERYVELARAIPVDLKTAFDSLVVAPAMLDDARDQLRSVTLGSKARFRMAVLLKLNDLEADEVIKINPRSVSVEHVLPQNTNKKSSWRGTFRHAKSGKYVGSDYLNRLGNLTILGHADNRKAGNEDWLVKRPIFRASAHALAKEAGSHRVWNAETVEARDEAMFQVLVRVWKLSATSALG